MRLLILEMKKFLYKTVSLTFLMISLLIYPIKSFAFIPSIQNDIFIVSQQNTIINYEKSQPSAIDNPIDDPNFNVMRTTDINSSFGTSIIVVLLIAASIVPLASWYFSRSKPN